MFSEHAWPYWKLPWKFTSRGMYTQPFPVVREIRGCEAQRRSFARFLVYSIYTGSQIRLAQGSFCKDIQDFKNQSLHLDLLSWSIKRNLLVTYCVTTIELPDYWDFWLFTGSRMLTVRWHNQSWKAIIKLR